MCDVYLDRVCLGGMLMLPALVWKRNVCGGPVRRVIAIRSLGWRVAHKECLPQCEKCF